MNSRTQARRCRVVGRILGAGIKLLGIGGSVEESPIGVVELLHDHLEQLLRAGQPERRCVDRCQPYGSKGKGCVVLQNAECFANTAIARGPAEPTVAPVQLPDVLGGLSRDLYPFQAATTLSSRPGRER